MSWKKITTLKGSPDTGIEIVEKINELPTEPNYQIDKDHIKGLEKGANITDRSIQLIGGGRGIQLKVGGIKKGLVKTINLIAGTNITITHITANGRNDITFDATGGVALSVLTATGNVNGVNTAFTFTSKPKLVLSDGAAYQENKGWVWTAISLTATMDIPPSFDIYGLA